MTYGQITGLKKPVSRIVYGTLFLNKAEKAWDLLYSVVASGCNTFDCAAIYGNGECETILGSWIRARKVKRDDIVIVTKGGCGNQDSQWAVNMSEVELKKELNSSLKRLGVKHVDVYMLHRDDPATPVSDIVNMMDGFVNDGMVTSWGVSNWTSARLEEALEYAKSTGKILPSCDSVQASLAEAAQPVWPGTEYMTEKRADWYSDKPVSVLAWECLAKGFLAGMWGADIKAEDVDQHAKRRRVDDCNSPSWREAQLTGAYITVENVERRDRCRSLAIKKGATMGQIALAYVLAQKYNSFVLVGTTKEEHFRSNANAAGVSLSEAEVAYLEYGTEIKDKAEIELCTPVELCEEIPITSAAAKTVQGARLKLGAGIEGKDDRLMVLVGPCSIHDPEAAMDYAQKLMPLANKHAEDLVVVMRVYFEKPRTTVGWKGLISYPDLNGTFNVGKGLRTARKLLLDVNNMGLPAGTEFLSAVTADYISDLVSYGAIGARTTESQVHREMASGLGMPVGFKNATSGDVQVAVDAIGAAKAKASFLGTNKRGRPAVINTDGNPHSHLILRGGSKGPNFAKEFIVEAEGKLKGKTSICVDCSHGNSNKKHENQPLVATDIAQQITDGNTSITGVMIESHLVEGAQKLSPGQTDPTTLVYGKSVTDACINMANTVECLEVLAKAVRARRERAL